MCNPLYAENLVEHERLRFCLVFLFFFSGGLVLALATTVEAATAILNNNAAHIAAPTHGILPLLRKTWRGGERVIGVRRWCAKYLVYEVSGMRIAFGRTRQRMWQVVSLADYVRSSPGGT